MKPEPDLKSLTSQMYEVLSGGDISFMERYLSQQDGVLAIGTDPNEWWTGYATIINVFKAEMEKMGGVSLVAGNPQAYSDDSVGWVADQSKFKLPDGTEIPFRLTCVFRKESNVWKLVQWHASIGVRNEDLFGSMFTT
jgi:hypothetical protein